MPTRHYKMAQTSLSSKASIWEKASSLLKLKPYTYISLFLFFSFISPILATSHTRSQWIAKYDELNSNFNSGNGWASNPSSSILAWGQSDFLCSYLNMYEATQDVSYLNSFVSQVNTMIGTMDDANNDGFYGWDTHAYSTNIVRNNGAEEVDLYASENQVSKTLFFEDDFETPSGSDPTLPAGWTRWQSSSSSAYLNSNDAYAGIYGCTVETNPNIGWQVIEKTISCVPDKAYMVEFCGKISGIGSEGYIEVLNFSTGEKIGQFNFDNTTWMEHRFVFRTSPGCYAIRFRLFHTAWNVNNFAAHFDNIKIFQLNENLLPEYWTRWQSTAATAYMDLKATNKTEGYAGFTIETNPNRGWQLLESALKNTLVNDNQNYEPGITYNVSFGAKTSNALTGWRFEIYDFTASQLLFSQTGTNTEWNTFSGTFTAPNIPDHDVRVRLYHINWSVSGSAHFDSIKVNQYAEYAVHDGMIAIPLAKFIMQAYKGQIPASYINDADTFLGVLENHLFPKWNYCLLQLSSTQSVYVAPDDGSLQSPNDSLPHNQYLALAVAYAFLSRALDGTSGTAYAELAGKLTNTFAGKLRTVTNNAYEWNYWDILKTGDNAGWDWIEDTSHANIDINASINCYKAGVTICRDDMERFANTFIYKMWNGNTSNPAIGKYINSSEDPIYQYITYAWIQLAAFDHSIYDIIRLMHDLIWSDSEKMTYRRMLVISEIIKGVLVTNELFETPDSQDNTLPNGWVRWQSSSSTAFLDSSNEFEGNNCLTVKTNGILWQVIQKDITYEPGTTYQVKLMGRRSGNPLTGGNVIIYDFTTSSTLGAVSFTNANWSQTVFTFTAPSTCGNDVKLRLYPTNYNVTDGIVHFDNVEIREIK